MKCRIATTKDLPTLKELWYECFLDHDSKASIDYYFENSFSLETTFILEVDDEIVTSLQLNQHNLSYNGKIESVSFVVGVATFKKHRKKGYMKVLLGYAIDYARSIYKQDYMILQAYDWNVYRPFGFVEAYYKEKLMLTDTDLTNIATTELLNFDSRKMLSIYERYTKDLNGYKIRDIAYFKQSYEMAMIDDVLIELSNDAYMYYQIDGSVLNISECAYDNFNELLKLIKTVLQQSNIKNINLVTDIFKYDKVYPHERELYTMIKELNDTKFEITDNLYISEVI